MAKMNNRTVSAIQLALFIIAIAVALIVYGTTHNVAGAFCALLLVTGLILMILSALRNKDGKGIGPSDQIYQLAVGAVVFVIGIAGTIWTCTDLGAIYIAAIVLIGIALIGIIVAVINNNREA